ncbi:MAG: hypothetical protein IT376_21275 [Polyangiaceae bacterium]|nr:hypothetical protein [Polyangiaceae bacterium]
MPRARLAPLTTLLLLLGCARREDAAREQGQAPPPPAAASAGACAGGGGGVADPGSAGLFPRVAAGYCVDPNGETRAFGQSAPSPLEAVCLQVLDGECEVYRRYGLARAVTLRYVDGGGTSGTVDVKLSRFGSREGAFGFFTKRVVADSDPARTNLAGLDAGGAGALGSTIAYVWRGDHVLELTYANDQEAPAALKASAARVLPPLAAAIGALLPGELTLPEAVTKLPAAGRLPLGIAFQPRDALDVPGLGPGAVAFHADGGVRYRTLALVRADDAAARDVMATLRRLGGARKREGLPFEAVVVAFGDGVDAPRVEWVIGRVGSAVLGIGDEPLARPAADAAAGSPLSADAKAERLRAWAAPATKP